MDQVKLDKMIKENRGILRQLTDITNRLEKLENAKEEEKVSSMGKFQFIFHLPPTSELVDHKIEEDIYKY